MFYLFGGDNYYPRGGPRDFIKKFETEEAALAYLDKLKKTILIPENELYFEFNHPGLEWWEIVDNDMNTIASGGRNRSSDLREMKWSE